MTKSEGFQSAAEMQRIITLFDDPHFARLAATSREQFKSADPFPHIVIDDFLPQDVASILARTYPDPNDHDVRWKTHANKNVSRKFVEDVSALELPMRLFASATASREFLLFLETISGIDCLIGDPYFIGGGAMATGNGEFLKVHADFDWHHKLQAHRRLNALFYLAPDWQPEWGGNLELWAKDMSTCVHSVEPKFNRLVIFEVTDDANHGQPEPLKTPESIFRRVFSAFYYTTRKSDFDWEAPHFTLYKPENSPYGMSLQKDYLEKANK